MSGTDVDHPKHCGGADVDSTVRNQMQQSALLVQTVLRTRLLLVDFGLCTATRRHRPELGEHAGVCCPAVSGTRESRACERECHVIPTGT